MNEKIAINQDFFVFPKDDAYEIWMTATIGTYSYKQLLCEVTDSYRARSFAERLKHHFESVFYIPQWTEVFTAKHMKEVI